MSEHDDPVEDANEVREHNIEESRRLIEEKKKARSQGNIHQPNMTDPRRDDQSVPPGQWDVPRGGSTGQEIGGTAKERDRKPRS